MFRATTPVHTFVFKEDPTEFEKILITYAQNGQILLEKTKEDLDFDTYDPTECGNTMYTASLQLTQEETKLFQAQSGSSAKVQVRVKDSEGNVWASDKKSVLLRDVFNDEVL